MKTIIMLSGWKRSGKNESANYLCEHYAMKQYALADSLKDSVADRYGVTRSSLDNHKKESPLPQLPAYGDDSLFASQIYDSVKNELAVHTDGKLYFTPRALCIIEGNLMRAIKPNFWIDNVAHQIRLDNSARTFVISDFRFKNEYERFVEYFGRDGVISVRINRFSDINTTSPSERELDNFVFDHTISNTSDIENLHRQLDVMVNKEFGGRWL